jgi:hypothetical protein
MSSKEMKASSLRPRIFSISEPKTVVAAALQPVILPSKLMDKIATDVREPAVCGRDRRGLAVSDAAISVVELRSIGDIPHIWIRS